MSRTPFAALLLLGLFCVANAGPCSQCYRAGMKLGPCDSSLPIRIVFSGSDCEGSPMCFQAGTYNTCYNDSISFLTYETNMATGYTKTSRFTTSDCSGEPFMVNFNHGGVCWNNPRLHNSLVDLSTPNNSWLPPVTSEIDKSNPQNIVICVDWSNCPKSLTRISFKDSACQVFQSAQPIVTKSSDLGKCLFLSTENHVFTTDGLWLTDIAYAAGCHLNAPMSETYTKIGYCMKSVSGSEMIYSDVGKTSF